MLQLKNTTPFAASIVLFPNEQGVDTLYSIVRASFNIGAKWTLADEQVPPVEADEYWAEPESSSLKSASDFHTGKPATDIIVTGHACAPGNVAVRQLDVGVSVGQVKKQIRVWGDRRWEGGRITAPEVFESMPLVYEKAYGGCYAREGEAVEVETCNPIGSGFVGRRTAKELEGLALPNLEDPKNLIGTPKDRPVPACFSFISPNWLPRVSYVGTYDEQWQSQRAPFLPHDFDKRFYNMAHPDLVYPGYLQGDEVVQISNMHPNGDLRFKLPQIKLNAKVDSDKTLQHGPFNLETVLIEPNNMQLSLVWKAAMVCDKQALKVKQVNIALLR